MKEKVVIFGLGKDFQRYKQIISQRFDVVACTDNGAKREIEQPWADCFINPASLIKLSFDKVLVCSRMYFYGIKAQLVRMGIDEDKIVCVEVLDRDLGQAAFEEVLQDMELYKKKNTDKKFVVSESTLYFVGDEKHKAAGIPSQHYFAQDIWGGQKYFKIIRRSIMTLAPDWTALSHICWCSVKSDI